MLPELVSSVELEMMQKLDSWSTLQSSRIPTGEPRTLLPMLKKLLVDDAGVVRRIVRRIVVPNLEHLTHRGSPLDPCASLSDMVSASAPDLRVLQLETSDIDDAPKATEMSQ